VFNTGISKGSLWIRTDGSTGGKGGDGGNGQLGGASSCKVGGAADAVHADGGNGGNGGNGGAGGRGGATSNVRLNVVSATTGELVKEYKGTCDSVCGQSERPLEATGSEGAIVVWGAPGCSGAPGEAGMAGKGGDQMERKCPWPEDPVKGGTDGVAGTAGVAGKMGPCGH
jgi:hypothetical protein